MAIKIISRRSSYLERSVTFEVDGKVETISGPSTVVTFEDLENLAEEYAKRYGRDGEKAVDASADEKNDAVKVEEKPVEEKTTTGKKSTSKKKSA